MAEQGGYRKPANPAAVSGPGAFSQRTDGQPGVTTQQAKQYVGGGEYGTNKAFNEDVVGGAPMAGAPTMAPQAMQTPAAMPSMPEPPLDLFAPTTDPNRPITSGVDMGEGPGSEALKYPTQVALSESQDLQKAAAMLKLLAPLADRPDSSFALRQTVRKLKGTVQWDI
jgi:hypothetical protein